MKFSCSREELFNKLNIVTKAISSRSVQPILQCVLVTADKTGVVLTATDLELGMESSPIPATVKKEGSIALENKMFLEIIRRFSGETVIMETDKSFGAEITCGFSKFKIMGLNGEEFPALPSVSKDSFIEISKDSFKEAVKKTIFSVSQDPSKPVLTGELMEISGKELKVVSVDGFRISCYFTNSNGNKDGQIIVPAKTMSEVSRILGADEEDENMRIYITDNHVLFELDDVTVISRLISGTYMKYETSFPPEFKTQFTAKKDDLISALERAMLISRDSRKTPVVLTIDDGILKISSTNETGKALEDVEINSVGDKLEIAFNPRYLLEPVKVIDDDYVTLKFNSPLSPCIIVGAEEQDCKYLALPLRM
ncbi:MAG: DNA polymerase III subunit beta [Firmicutes bacterium]|nr:DNA polymerase III subunit beta [Bacillota bacterium]MBR2593763.1 DNA polymerase III subunit beta [Bacillota bacterium]